MADFPNTFTEHPVVLESSYKQDIEVNRSLVVLNEKGFEVIAGISRADVSDITAIAGQDGIREYCPKDIATRWGSEEMAEAQLAKNGGRGAFLLKETRSGKLAGYGWTGHEPCDELPHNPITFALRLSEEFQGNHLAVPFTNVIVAGSMALYGAHGIGLETWGSNTKAVKTYLATRAELVTPKDDMRPTLKPAANEPDGMRRDVRLFMKWAYTL